MIYIINSFEFQETDASFSLNTNRVVFEQVWKILV